MAQKLLLRTPIEAYANNKRNNVAFAATLWFHPAMFEQLPDSPGPLIRAAGIKATPLRIRVFAALLDSCQALSHAEIEARLTRSGSSPVDRVTLYRILDSLTNCGLALKAIDLRGVFRFSASLIQTRHENHLHFRCRNCGGVFCLKTALPPPPKLPPGFQLGSIEVDLSGTCPSCSES